MRDPFELQPASDRGARLADLAAKHADDFWERADVYDRENRFAFENVEALKQSGFVAACIPESFGGLGIVSVQDYAVGINRLARGDAATAIAINMHLIAGWTAARIHAALEGAEGAPLLARAEQQLRLHGSREVIVAAVNSEPGTLPHRPLVCATRVPEGYRIDGRKIFGTLSPVADFFQSLVRVEDPAGDLVASATIPRDAPGVEVQGNWDALGMRATGSHDVVYRDCIVPEDALVPIGPWGAFSPSFFEVTLVNHVCLTAAFLGIAERARALITEALIHRTKQPGPGVLADRPAIQLSVADLEVDLTAARAALDRIARLADAFVAEHSFASAAPETFHPLSKEFQSTKYFVQRRCIDIVDRAMTLSGGAGYMSSNPLSRLYRDVRAGPFMQPFSPNEALIYIGRVALGRDPTEDL